MSDSLTQALVKGTLLLLALASALTWTLVVVKGLQQRRLALEDRRFAKVFGSFSVLPSAAEVERQSGPAARVAAAGVQAWNESNDTLTDEPAPLEVRRDLLERQLKQQLHRERRTLESGLPVLASIGSTAPFIGLFGTVLGIVHALSSIGSSGSASLDVVAGPIGEALLATAIGIAVAVPAVLAYNFFLRRLKTVAAELEDFANSLVGAAVRDFSRIGPPKVTKQANDARVLAQEASA